MLGLELVVQRLGVVIVDENERGAWRQLRVRLEDALVAGRGWIIADVGIAVRAIVPAVAIAGDVDPLSVRPCSSPANRAASTGATSRRSTHASAASWQASCRTVRPRRATAENAPAALLRRPVRQAASR